MNSKERFLTAMRNGVPDQVPVARDIANFIPAKRTGLPFGDVYFFNKIALWRAYLEAADYYGMAAWVASNMFTPLRYAAGEVEKLVTHDYRHDLDAMIQRTTWRTSAGTLTAEETCFRGDPPSRRRNPSRISCATLPRSA